MFESFSLSSRARGAIAACSFAALLAVPAVASATTLTAAQSYGTFNITLSDAFGTGSFGTVKVTDLGSGVADIKLDVSPNFVLDTGAHFAFTFSLATGGTVDASSVSPNPNFSLVTTAGPYSNSPFGNFNVAIQSSCTLGNCGPGDGSTIDLHVLNFAGLLSATSQYTDASNVKHDIFFAADIFKFGCTGDGCTGVVGASTQLGGGNQNETPLPGAVLLMSTVLGGGAGIGAWRRRKKKSTAV
jgi:hypothetical protein